MHDVDKIVSDIAGRAKQVRHELIALDNEKKNKALLNIAQAIDQHRTSILHANKLDVKKGKDQNMASALIDRLLLDNARIDDIIQAIHKVIALPDPVGKVISESQESNGLTIRKVSVPLGVIGMIYEARPNVTSDAAILAIKSGNAIVLRSSSNCIESSIAIVKAIHHGLINSNLSSDIVQIIPLEDRSAVESMLKMDKYIDVIIPRGGKSLCQHIQEHSKIPTLQHLDGNCCLYIHNDADPITALQVLENAKMRRVSICGATESLIIDLEIARTLLHKIVDLLSDKHQCIIKGDKEAITIDNRIVPASEQDWYTEYLDKVISTKIVNNQQEAIDFINKYSSGHTDCIITQNQQVKQEFFKYVDSAIVMHNTSTQFADGEEFGMGAEIGIATGKLHARGPVGIQQLNTYKYIVTSDGAVRT